MLFHSFLSVSDASSLPPVLELANGGSGFEGRRIAGSC
jgi:hypothetical protein